jgi:hypothetical protein
MIQIRNKSIRKDFQVSAFVGLLLGLAILAAFLYSKEEWRWLAYEGALLAVIANTRYAYAMIKKNVRPTQVSWVLWTFTTFLGFVASIGAGAKDGAIVTGAYLCIISLVTLLLWRKPKLRSSGGEWYDWWIGGLVLGGLLIYWVLKSAELPIVLAVIADGIAIFFTARNAWSSPQDEDLLAWSLDVPAALLGVLAVGSFGFFSIAYLLSVALGAASVAGVVAIRKWWLPLNKSAEPAKQLVHR